MPISQMHQVCPSPGLLRAGQLRSQDSGSQCARSCSQACWAGKLERPLTGGSGQGQDETCFLL